MNLRCGHAAVLPLTAEILFRREKREIEVERVAERDRKSGLERRFFQVLRFEKGGHCRLLR